MVHDRFIMRQLEFPGIGVAWADGMRSVVATPSVPALDFCLTGKSLNPV